jgi:hypothetical protein
VATIVLASLTPTEWFVLVVIWPLLAGAMLGIFKIVRRERGFSLALLLLAITIVSILMGLAAVGLRK